MRDKSLQVSKDCETFPYLENVQENVPGNSAGVSFFRNHCEIMGNNRILLRDTFVFRWEAKETEKHLNINQLRREKVIDGFLKQLLIGEQRNRKQIGAIRVQ